jgi:multidrug resistance efflux pump
MAFDEGVFPALALTRSSTAVRRIAKWLAAGLALTLAALVFAPWQQSVTGAGNVLAYSPNLRQQSIEAPIKGRIVRWGDGIHENALVTKGQVIAEIRDLDESYTARLDLQTLNSQQAVMAAQQHLEASERALVAAQSIVESYQAQVNAYRTVKVETQAAQDAFVDMAEQKVLAEQQQLAEYEAAVPQLQAEYDRLVTLHAEGNIALQKVQETDRKLKEAQAKVSRAKAYVAAAESELEGKQRERTAKIEKAQVDVDYAEAALRKSRADVSKAESDIAKSRQELNKAEKDLLDMQIKVARQQSQQVLAPFDGYLVQISPNQGTAIIKEGDPICTIVPETSDRAVQIWLNGNDAPLVEPGRHVRLQFEGWPAVQFAGWPSVAVGTFGGKVISVDATDNGYGKFRVLVRPDSSDRAWPEQRFLRQGVRANGWVLLNEVPLWYEFWRRINGFPPTVSFSDQQSITKAPKGSK